MSNKNEVNQIFSYLSKNNEIPTQKLSQIYSNVYRSMGTPESVQTSQNSQSSTIPSKSLTKMEFQTKLNEALNQKNIDEELLLLFYNLDREKKGYLTPQDIVCVFGSIDKNMSLNEVENSFKYVKVYKNKMTFQDFKEYFYNF